MVKKIAYTLILTAALLPALHAMDEQKTVASLHEQSATRAQKIAENEFNKDRLLQDERSIKLAKQTDLKKEITHDNLMQQKINIAQRDIDLLQKQQKKASLIDQLDEEWTILPTDEEVALTKKITALKKELQEAVEQQKERNELKTLRTELTQKYHGSFWVGRHATHVATTQNMALLRQKLGLLLSNINKVLREPFNADQANTLMVEGAVLLEEPTL